jgi:GntR family transcriptional regulator
MLHLLVDRHSGHPVYRQIVDQVRFQVAAGTLPVGAELPSTRTLAAEHALNPMTVSKAYAELERLGVLDRRPGLPHVVARRSLPTADADRQAALRRSLEPGARAARQLGVPPAEAAAVLRELMESEEGDR